MSRIRADQLVNRAGSGGPKFPHGVAEGFSVSGIVTATSYRGDGSQLTGIDASSLKDGSNVKVQATNTGATVTGDIAATGNVTAVNVTASGNVSAVNATFSGDLTVNGTTTTIDTAVTSVDSLSLDGNITIGSTVHAPDFTDGGAAKAITIGTTGDALLVTHSSGQGLGYFGYEAGGDRLVVACDGGSGSNKIDFITDAGTTSGGSTDNLNGKVPKMRITAGGDVGIASATPAARLDVYKNFGGVDAGNYAGRVYGTDSGVSETGVRFVTKGTGNLYSVSDAYLMHGISNGTTRFVFGANGNVGINSTAPAGALDVGGNVFPAVDNTHDLGSASKRWANVYTGDLNLSNEGSANDVDGTWGQYTIQEGEDDLFLINRRTGKKYKFNLTEVD